MPLRIAGQGSPDAEAFNRLHNMSAEEGEGIYILSDRWRLPSERVG